MPPRPRRPYGRPVRVVIEFEETDAGGWRGSVSTDRGIEGRVPFEGRLQLLRFLEEVVPPARTPIPPSKERQR